MLVQDALRSGSTLDDLANRYAIKATRSVAHPSLVLLKYSQIDSPMVELLVRECRGLILDEADNWRVISRSFDKFFNHGESHAAAIDWTTAQVQEKLDGSLCVLYHYAGKWHVQTSGQPDASGKVSDENFTFADLFWRTFQEQGYVVPGETDVCVAFELMSKWNRVVVQHATPKLTMIGIRDRRTGRENALACLAHVYEPVHSFSLQSFDDIAATFKTMEPLKQEGYVVVDGNFNRVKVKHPGYVAIHHLKDNGASKRRLCEIVLAGEVGEFAAYFPEWSDEFAKIEAGVTALCRQVEDDYKTIQASNPATQKDFALLAVKTKLPAALFALRRGQVVTVREYVAQMQADDVLRLIGIKGE